MEKDINQKIDKYDVDLSISSGVLTAAMNVLWIGDISLADAHEWSSDKIDDFPMDGDLLTKEFESGAQHHLRDFSHYPTPVSLMFSLLMQFTGKGYETKTNGEFVSYDVLDGKRKVSRILFI